MTMQPEKVAIAMPDGTAEAFLAHPPQGGPGPGVLFFMDAMGLRPALGDMVMRIANEGYTVLAPDVFYRSQPYGPFDPVSVLSDKEQLRALGRMNRAFANPLFEADSHTYLKAIDSHAAPGPCRTTGYCMGGRCALTLAGFHPERVVAAASFHGGELAPEHEHSPHLLADRMQARIYVGVAETDAFFEAGEEGRLMAALRAGKVNHILETYPGTQHGFAIPDLPVHHPQAAEHHYQQLFRHFAKPEW